MLLLMRLREFASLWRQIPLAARLLLDRRTPLRAKLILLGVLVLIVSPINWIPNAIPVVGELDDLALLLLGVQLFLNNVPDWLRAERAGRSPSSRQSIVDDGDRTHWGGGRGDQFDRETGHVEAVQLTYPVKVGQIVEVPVVVVDQRPV